MITKTEANSLFLKHSRKVGRVGQRRASPWLTHDVVASNLLAPNLKPLLRGALNLEGHRGGYRNQDSAIKYYKPVHSQGFAQAELWLIRDYQLYPRLPRLKWYY